MKHGTIITIGRQCGSGGHEIGLKLAEKLGIPYYDKELLRLAAEKSGIAPENFELYDEVPTSSLLYSLSLGDYGFTTHHMDMPIHQKIFLAQFETIQELADKGESCVILGRCADYALARREQVVTVFVRADPKARVQRLVSQYSDLNEKKAADQMVKTDRRRAIQDAYNRKNGIIPKTIVKGIRDVIEVGTDDEKGRKYRKTAASERKLSKSEAEKLIAELTAEMKRAAQKLEFEQAAFLRDEISRIRDGKTTSRKKR